MSSRASSSTEALMTTLNKSMCQRHTDRAAAQEIRPQNFAFAHAEVIDMSMTPKAKVYDNMKHENSSEKG